MATFRINSVLVSRQYNFSAFKKIFNLGFKRYCSSGFVSGLEVCTIGWFVLYSDLVNIGKIGEDVYMTSLFNPFMSSCYLHE
jgi:hypothetical protein